MGVVFDTSRVSTKFQAQSASDNIRAELLPLLAAEDSPAEVPSISTLNSNSKGLT